MGAVEGGKLWWECIECKKIFLKKKTYLHYLDNMQYSQEDTKSIYESNTLTSLSSCTNDLSGSTHKGNVSVGSLDKT